MSEDVFDFTVYAHAGKDEHVIITVRSMNEFGMKSLYEHKFTKRQAQYLTNQLLIALDALDDYYEEQ